MAKTCASCGAVLGKKALFCKRCGAKAPSSAICRECGAEVKPDAKFCGRCGALMEAAPDIVIPAPSDAEVYVTDKPTASLPTCPSCGAKVRLGAAFCRKCGAPLAKKPTAPLPTCPSCGEKVRLGAAFCRKCGAPLAKKPTAPLPTCPSCGAKVHRSEAFCGNCGASLTGTAASQPQITYAPPPQYSPQAQPAVQGGQAPKRKSGRLILKIVAVVLVIAIVITGVRHYAFYWDSNEPGGGGYDHGGHTVGGDVVNPVSDGEFDMSFMPEYSASELAAAPTVQLPVSPEAAFARDENVEVDFGEYNLLEQTTLSVARLPEKSVPSKGLSVTAYDLSMANGINAFSLPVTVTLPLTCASDEVSDIRVFDESAGVWEAVPSVADYQAGTITFSTSHFCTIAELKMKGASLEDMTDIIPLQNGYFVYDGDFNSTGALTPVTLPMSEFVKLIESSAYSGESIMYMLQKGRVEADDAYSALMKLGDFNAGVYDEMFALDEMISGVSNPMVTRVGRAFQALGAAILVARMSYQAYNGAAVGDILWSNAPDIAATACTAYGLAYAYPPAMVAATVIFALSSLYDAGGFVADLSDAEHQQEMAYRTFCGATELYFTSQSCVMFNADTLELSVDYSDERFNQEPGEKAVKWVRLDPGGAGLTAAINVIFQRYIEQPEQLDAAIKKLLDDYVGLFFSQSDEAIIKYLDDYSMLHDVTQMPSAEQIEDFEERFRSHLYGKAAPIFKEFAKKASDELMTKLYNDVVPELLEQLNTVISFQIVDDALGGDTFDNSTYANGAYTISFDYDDGRWENQRAKNYGQIKSKCIFAPQEGSNEVFRCNVYSLMQLNFPQAMLITPINNGMGAPIRLPFELEAPVTAVLLKNESYDGVYTGESSAAGMPAFYIGTANGHMYAAPAKNNGYFDIELYKEVTYNEATGNWEAYLQDADGGEFMYSLHFTPDGRDMRLEAQVIFSDETAYYNLIRTGPIEEEAPMPSPEWVPPTDYELSPVIPD